MRHRASPTAQGLGARAASAAPSCSVSRRWPGRGVALLFNGVGGASGTPLPLLPWVSDQPPARTSEGAGPLWGWAWAARPLPDWRTCHVRAGANPPLPVPAADRGSRALQCLHWSTGAWLEGCQKTLVDINVCSLQDLCVHFQSHLYVIFLEKHLSIQQRYCAYVFM